MRTVILLVVSMVFFSCVKLDKANPKEPGKFISQNKRAQPLNEDELVIDSASFPILYQLMADPNAQPIVPPDDTIYNAKGKPLKVILRDDIFGASYLMYSYDSLDRKIQITGYDNLGKVRAFYKDIAIQKYAYDNKGNLIEIRNLGIDGNLISAEYEDTPVIQMRYDEKNRLVEQWFFNDKGKLRGDFSIIKWAYDGEGKMIELGWFDENGNKK